MFRTRGPLLLVIGYAVLIAVLVATLFHGVTWNPSATKKVAYVAGCTAYVLFCCQFLLSARLQWLDRCVPLDRLYALHGSLAVVALAVVWCHGILVTLGSEHTGSQLREAGELARLLLLLASLGGAILLGTTWLERVPHYPAMRRKVRQLLHLRYHWCVWLHNFALVGATVMLGHVMLLHAPTMVPFKVVCALLYAACVGVHLYHRLLRWRLLPAWACTTVTPVTEDVHTLRLAPPPEADFDFLPGQFAYISLDSPGLREWHPFTIAGRRDGGLEFSIKTVGDWTRAVGAAQPGTQARLHGPFGAFTSQRPAPDRPLVLLAGGIGITPFLAVLRQLAAEDSPRRVTLVWSVRHRSDAFAQEELDELSSRLPDLRATLWVSEGDGGRGRITYEFLGELLPGDATAGEAFLCGPPGFMDAMAKCLQQLGLRKAQLHQERFGY